MLIVLEILFPKLYFVKGWNTKISKRLFFWNGATLLSERVILIKPSLYTYFHLLTVLITRERLWY